MSLFRKKWSSLLLILLLCSGKPAAYSQTGRQDLGQFEGHADLGTILRPGNARYDASTNSYTVSGSGANLWFGVDDFHYVWKKISGDISLSADIDFVGNNGNAHRKAVLMIRQTLDPHSIYADVARHGDGLTSLQYRDTVGADTHEIETYANAPHRVGLEKRGDYVYVSIPDSAGNLVPSGAAMHVSIKGDYYVGLGVCSHNDNVTEAATFSNLDLKSLVPGTGEPVLHSTLETVIVASTDRRVRFTSPTHLEDPNWTPDGNALIFDQGGTLQRLALDDGIHPIDSTLPRSTSTTPILTAPLTRINGDHGISPDGSLIAVGNEDPDGVSRVYVVPMAGGTARRVTAKGSSYFHAWSPDGKTISFTGLTDNNFGAYTIPVAGGQETLMVSRGDVAEFSPDGQWIYYQSDRSGHMQIWRRHPHGSSDEQLLVSDTSDWFPHISPDGKMIAFVAYKPGTQGHPANQDVEIRVLSLADRKVRTLASLLGGRGTMNVPSWSPDSRMLAFASYEFLPD